MVQRAAGNPAPNILLFILIGLCSPVVVLFVAKDGSAVDEKPLTSKARQEALVEERSELMRKIAGGFDIQSNEPEFPSKLETKPIFRYSDPVRGAIAASLHRELRGHSTIGSTDRRSRVSGCGTSSLAKGMMWTTFRMIFSNDLCLRGA